MQGYTYGEQFGHQDGAQNKAIALLFLWRFSEHSQFGKGEIIYVIWIGKFLDEPEHFFREMDVWNILFSLLPMLRCYRYCMCRFDLDQ